MSRKTDLEFTPEGFKRRWQDMDRRIANLERQGQRPQVVPPQQPAVFHWSGAVEDYVDDRNGPWVFPSAGQLYVVRYLFDTAPASDGTIEWYFDGSGTPTWTHTLTASETDQRESESLAYDDEPIIGIVTSIDSTAAGLTALIYQR